MALDRLIEGILKCKNPTVAGLDPKLDYIPAFIKEKAFARYGETLEGAAAAILEFNRGLIDALCGIVPAVKPQCAYYELYGWQGVKTLHDTITYAKEKGMFVITDGKRNDIGTTMQAYAQAHLGSVAVGSQTPEPFGGDALTVNPYLGSDGVTPLLDVCKAQDKGIFILVKTSNPSSGELQDQVFGSGETLYKTVGGLCEKWGEALPGKYGYSGVGAVVGATYPEQLRELRHSLPHTFFLVPGYGAQGGGAKDVAPAFDPNGLGAVINASRSIMTAWKKNGAPEQDYAKEAAKEAVRMRDEIVGEIGGMSRP
ncbi:MAG: orotidine-5'-phosphate decarboxylase [Clostridiales bacterium]|jgi:orotidine-5'-phosphate decarboxylase|nr:orotidine-5'-phosphate decarboxylase [Clostridiales bacterium]